MYIHRYISFKVTERLLTDVCHGTKEYEVSINSKYSVNVLLTDVWQYQSYRLFANEGHLLSHINFEQPFYSLLNVIIFIGNTFRTYCFITMKLYYIGLPEIFPSPTNTLFIYKKYYDCHRSAFNRRWSFAKRLLERKGPGSLPLRNDLQYVVKFVARCILIYAKRSNRKSLRSVTKI